MGPAQFGAGGNPVTRVRAKHYVWWTIDDVVAWFAIRFEWSPTSVLTQPMGDLRRICWQVREVDRKRKDSQDA